LLRLFLCRNEGIFDLELEPVERGSDGIIGRRFAFEDAERAIDNELHQQQILRNLLHTYLTLNLLVVVVFV